MSKIKSLIIAVSLIVACGVCAVAQSGPNVASDAAGPVDAGAEDYSALIRSVFAPFTDELNLTKEQQFQVVAIVSGARAEMEPLLQELGEVDRQLNDSTLVESFDETKVRQLATREARIGAEIIALKVSAKARLFQVLTPGQKEFVMRRRRSLDVQPGGVGGVQSMY